MHNNRQSYDNAAPPDIPESQWIVHSNRSRLYLWTYDADGNPDRKLYGQLLREPGVRIDKENHMLYLDYEIRARHLRRKNARADISQRAIEEPFLAYVKPDVGLYGSSVENGFTQWLEAEQGIRLRQTPTIGGPAVRGIYDGSDCVKAQISNYSYEVGGYICSWVNYKVNADVQFCNEFNNIGFAKKVDNYQRLQTSGLRTAAAMARMRLHPDGHDPVVEAAKNHPIFFATNEERQGMRAEQERKRKAQADTWARIDEANIQTLTKFYQRQPRLSEVDYGHVGLRYLQEKHILDVVRDIGDLRVSNGATLPWIEKDSSQRSEVTIHPGLLLPMHDEAGAMRNAQIIFYNRNRETTQYAENIPGNTRNRLYMALPTAGLMYQFPGEGLGKAGIPVIVAEGFSTGASLFAATRGCAQQFGKALDIPVVVAWDAGGLGKVIPILHNKYPDNPILIAADNDAAKSQIINSRTGKPYPNTGVETAKKIAALMPNTVKVMIPPLHRFPPNRSVDFNDVHVEHGISAVQDILKPHLANYGINLTHPDVRNSNDHKVNIPDAITQIRKLMHSGQSLTDIPTLPPAFNDNLRKYGSILRRDMLWLQGGGKAWRKLSSGQVQMTILPDGILLPLRNFAGKVEDVALFTADKGFEAPTWHLHSDLNGSYYPISINRDKSNSATVILTENFLDAMMIKQGIRHHPPTIFVCFNPQNMLDVSQEILKKQPGKSIALLPDTMHKNTAKFQRDCELMDNFCKLNGENVQLWRFPGDPPATRSDFRDLYRQLVQSSKSLFPLPIAN